VNRSPHGRERSGRRSHEALNQPAGLPCAIARRVGTFHNFSKKHRALYVAEFQFRYNNRENADISGTAIKGC
jgi:hypothetical protein